MPDQLRADAVGAFGNPVVETPNIDTLAADGVRFDSAYAQHSVCSQSRISMFTGWYPHVAGHRTLDHLLTPDQPNVFRRLEDSGYHVALAGARGDMFAPGVTRLSSSRFGFTRPPVPEDIAAWHAVPFDEDSKWYGTFHGGGVDRDLFELDAATTATAVDWLVEPMPEPWCLFVPLIFPHPPFTVEQKWLDRYDGVAVPPPIPPTFDGKPGFYREVHERYGLHRLDGDDWARIVRTYYAMVSRVDEQFGRVRDAVHRAGCADRTVTFFFTDHGEYLGDFGLVEKWPAGVDEVLVRNPLIIHDPDRASGIHTSFAEMVDLTATLEDYAELEPAYTHFGRTLRPVIDDPAVHHRDAAFSEGGFLPVEAQLEPRSEGLYSRKAELQHDRPELVGKVMSIRTEDWTYVLRLHEPPELYDRGVDRGETTNLAGAPEHAQVERSLRDRLLAWLLETSDVVPWQRTARIDDDLLAAIIGSPEQ